MSFSSAWLTPSETSPTVVAALLIEIIKPVEKDKKEEQKLDEKALKIVSELVFMGFPKETIEEAIKKVKKVDMQEVLDEVLII